ncbi:hypothetical protein LO84_007 [Autographa californica multiple nucleopolyhedrovirus]|nr:hypothetical protein LO84_007 [Autographa californica multiple nucleopolyhedrovirus]
MAVIFNNKQLLADDSIENGGELFLLNGSYSILENYVNPVLLKNGNVDAALFKNIELEPAAYYAGNILYKTDDPKFIDYINLIIKATHSEELPENSTVVNYRKTMRSGTIHPIKKDIYIYDNKKFTLYDRYIYGYDNNYVNFYEEKNEKEKEYEEEDRQIKASSLCENKIILSQINCESFENDFKYYLSDYNYAFSIIDNTTNVLVAFGLYR